MVIKASVIKIYGSHNPFNIVRNKGFCVDESRFVFINLNAGIKERGIMAFCKGIWGKLIRNARKNYFHFNAPFRRKAGGCS